MVAEEGGEEDGQAAAPNNAPDSMDYQESNLVVGGDAAAAARAMERLNTVQGVKEKRIAKEKRSTTPYMTKYERARVLGTRALQIR